MQGEICDKEKEIKNDFDCSLSRVIYVTSACILGYLLVLSYGTHLLLKGVGRANLSGLGAAIGAVLTLLFVSYIVITSGAIVCLRPSVATWPWIRTSGLSYASVRLALIGVLGGLTASLIASPLPVSGTNMGVEPAALHIAKLIDYGHSAMLVLPIALALVFLVALCTEVLFRGIIFRSLTEHATMLAAAIASCLLCYLVWPIYNPVAGLILGMISAVLFYRTKKIAPSIISNMTFMLLAPNVSIQLHRFL